MRLCAGSFAVITAGRDKGRLMCIIKVVDKNSAIVADGRLRRLERPKRKSFKHLEPAFPSDTMSDEGLCNKLLRKKISELLSRDIQ